MTRARDTANLIGSGNFSSTTFTATAGQTAFTISHTQGFVQVFMNGLLLDETADYTSNGTAITLTSGAAAGDEIEVVKYDTFSVGDAITQTAADTRYVNATGDTMSGDLTVDTNTFHVDVADNRVGIGTSTPAKVLDITESASADTGQVKVTYAGGDGNRSGLILNNTHTGGREYGIYVGNNSTGGGLGSSLGISDNTAGTAYRLLISSDGRVTTPQVPSFQHASYSSYSVGTTGNQVMTNSNVWAAYNAGLHENGNSGWDFNTGIFTAPIGGRYFFSLTYTLSNFSSGYFWTYLQVNGNSKTYHQNWQTSLGIPTTNSMVVELAANDAVRCLWTNNYSGMTINYANFHGFLIG